MWAIRRASTNTLIASGLNTAAFRACAGLGPVKVHTEDKSTTFKPHVPTLDRWITSKTCNCTVPVPERFSAGCRFFSSQAGIESGGEETLKTDLQEDTEVDTGRTTISGLPALSNLMLEESSESLSGALNNYFEGKEISRSEVYQALLNLRRHKFFENAFQLLAWLEGRHDFDFSGRDYASMVDLIAKVHGLQKAEVYLDNIPESFREEVIFRTSLANYVSATLVKKSKQLNDKMESSGMACFVESPTSDNANDLRFMGREKASLLFPFFGATFFFQRDGLRVYNKLTLKDVREQLLGQLRKKCWNLMGKEAVIKLTKKSIDQDGMRELMKGTEMLTKIILKNKRIPYGYNSYLNEVKKMRSILSNRTSTDTIVESVKIRSVYQSAAMIAQDISMELKKKKSFRSIFSRIVRMVPVGMKQSGSRVEGIRVCVSGRLRGAEIAKSECGKYGKTSCNTIIQKIDYAAAEASTRYGNLGVKVWISYSSS